MAAATLFALVTWILSTQTDVCLSWPAGQYGLPMTISGCPVQENFLWLSGSRTHQTKAGSFVSDESHFAGTSPSRAYPVDRITQYFCMKHFYPSIGDYEWEPGKYCIYKVSESCPAGFKSGSLYWDDDVDLQYAILEHPVQSTTGSLPRGTYDRNTEIEFCCRGDGSSGRPIHLPNDVPFYLIRQGNECQKVEETSVHEEWIQWSGDHSFDHDAGLHPMHTRTTRYSRVYYCYYEQQKKSSTLKTVIFAILGIVAAVLIIVLIMFVVQRCIAMRKMKRTEETNTESQNTEPMLENRMNKERAAIYHPKRGDGKTADADGDVLLTVESRPISQPPSYADVLRQDSQLSSQVNES